MKLDRWYIFFLAVFLAAPSFSLSGLRSKWQPGDYLKYSAREFVKLARVHKRIDFSKIDYPLLHAAIFYETNRQRTLHHLPPFLYSPALEKAAFDHSRNMVRHDFFSHKSLVHGQKNLKDRLAATGISTGMMAENIAWQSGLEYEGGRSVYTPPQNGGYFSYDFQGTPILNHTFLGFARSVVKSWMNSPGHRQNILNRKLIFLGVGAFHTLSTEFYDMDYFKVTQNFSSTSSQSK